MKFEEFEEVESTLRGLVSRYAFISKNYKPEIAISAMLIFLGEIIEYTVEENCKDKFCDDFSTFFLVLKENLKEED